MKNEIIEMAVKAGYVGVENGHPALEAFAKLVEDKATDEANARANTSWTLMCKKMVAAEREACAKVCEESNDMGSSYGLAQAIRARGQE